MSSKRDADQRFQEGLGWLFGALALAALAVYAYPQSLGGLVGLLVAAAHPFRFDDNAERRHWRALAGWSIAAGLAVGSAWFAVDSVIGADAEWRRFDRKWGASSLDWSAWIEHPWAWLPLFAAAAMVIWGAAMIWRAR